MKVYVAVSWVLAGLITGVTFGYFGRGALTVTWKTEIDGVELAQIILGIVGLVVVQTYLGKRFQDLRTEKEYLLGSIRDAHSLSKTVRDLILQRSEEPENAVELGASIIRQFRTLSIETSTIEVVLRESSMTKLMSFHNEVKKAFHGYKVASTKGGFPAQPYARGDLPPSEAAFEALSGKWQILAIKINQA